jgi:outer membrane protein W
MRRMFMAGLKACTTRVGLTACTARAVLKARRARAGVGACAALVMVGVLMTPAMASAQQSLNFSVGGFVPRGEDGRSRDDVLVNNLDFLAFNIKDFSGATVGTEWLTGIGDKFEAGLGAGYYARTVPAVYLDFVNVNGTEIEQDIKLRVVPFTATIRFLPMGHNNGIEPYIGAGVGVLMWRYSETGQFLATDSSIFRDSFVTKGNASGPIILGGVRIPVGTWGLGFEARHQSAEGNIPSDQDFAGTKIDLGGFTYNFTIHVRF